MLCFSSFVLIAAELQSHSKSMNSGAICLGPDLSMIQPDSDIFISLDNSKKELFSDSRGKIPFKDLNLKKKHLIRLFKGDLQFTSFNVDFKKLKTNFVIVWKASGYWKSMAVGGEKCEWPTPSCPKGFNCP